MIEPAITALVTILLIIALVKELASPAFLMFGATIFFMVIGITDAHQALAGFSSPAMLTIAALFVVAAGLERTNAFHSLANALFGVTTSLSASLLRVIGFSGVSSIFLNNTAIVTMLSSTLLGWSKRRNFPISYFLMPSSFVAILGGLCSLIGTSTNLLIHGLMEEHGLEGMEMFELAWFGVPAILLGGVYLFFFSTRILSENKSIVAKVVESEKNYLCDVIIDPECELVGKTLSEAGLRHLEGLFLVNIERNNDMIGPVSPRERLQGGDRLVFAGKVNTLPQILRIPGIRPAYQEYFSFSHLPSRLKLFEMVVSYTSPLNGKNLREVQFRTKYNAAVLAVQRPEVNLQSKLGDIIFKPGDVLLVEAEENFYEQWRHSKDFFLVAEANGRVAKPSTLTARAYSIVFAMIAAVTFFNLPILHGAVLAAIAMVLTKCITLSEAKESVFKEFNILILVASAFGVGAAIESSGLAQLIANLIILQSGGLPPIVILASLVILTTLFTEFVTNNAAAAIMFPVGIASAKLIGVDPRSFAIAIAISASLCFITPFGYQTNLIIYGPGNYSFKDYIRFGIPIKLMMVLLCIALVPIFWPLN